MIECYFAKIDNKYRVVVCKDNVDFKYFEFNSFDELFYHFTCNVGIPNFTDFGESDDYSKNEQKIIKEFYNRFKDLI